MDALERLSQLGQVERVDQAVLDAALDELAGAVSQDAHRLLPGGRAIQRASRRITATAVAAALAAAALAATAVFAAVAWRGHSVPATRPEAARSASQGRSATSAAPRPPTIAAILTAFSASSNDILMVTKVVRGEGTCCRTIIWLSPSSTPGTTVRARIKNFSLDGARLSDIAFSYIASATRPAPASAQCDGIFLRPKLALPPVAGMPAAMTEVYYPGHIWVRDSVRVQPATVPSAGALRACLKDGQWRDLGQTERPEAKIIELVSSGGFVRLWVSAATFLPVRLTSITPTPYGPTTITYAFKYLLPTVADEATLMPPRIPAGFKRHRLPG